VIGNSSYSPPKKESSGIKSELLRDYRIQSQPPILLLRNTSSRASVTCLEKCGRAPSCCWSPVKLFEWRNVKCNTQCDVFRVFGNGVPPNSFVIFRTQRILLHGSFMRYGEFAYLNNVHVNQNGQRKST
jgi:hypothetical protein